MKEDKFKEFVDKHRDSFNIYREDYDEIWENIESKLDKQGKNEGLKTIWKVAASFLLVLAVGSLVLLAKRNGAWVYQGNQAVPVELAEAAFHYQGMINDKLEIIQANKHDVGEEIFEDLEALDQAYFELKNDLKDNADNEEVVQAMIQNYKMKLEILQAILDELKRNSPDNQEEDKTQDENVAI